jgi:hypothetical protein
MQLRLNKAKLVKRISRETFLQADVRSRPFKNEKKYTRKAKHKQGWGKQL